MVRSSKVTLKFSNTQKLALLEKLYTDYNSDLTEYIKLILNGNLPFKKLLSCKELPTIRLSHSHYKSILYKQASEIIRSNLKYTKNRTFKKYQKLYAIFIKKGIHSQFTNKKFSELNINYMKRIKIQLKNITIPIDERQFNFSTDSKEFNEFVGLKLPYFYENKHRAIQINLPIKYHKQYNKYKDWNRRKTVFLKKNCNGQFEFIFMFEKEDTIKKSVGPIIGIDLGYKKLISSSNEDYYGKEMESIYNKLSNKVRGSKNYSQYLKYKKDSINRNINLFLNEYDDVQKIVCEDLKLLRYKSKLSRKQLNIQQYFAYNQVLDLLEIRSQEKGFQLIKVNPAYTSQICSNCGEVDKSNRQGEKYQCKSCGFEADADYNAALNILTRGSYHSSTEKDLILESSFL